MSSTSRFRWSRKRAHPLRILPPRHPPRQGRYNNLIAGILLYIIYANLLGAAKVWLEQEQISPWLGVWWVHLLFIGFAIVMLMRQNNMFLRLWLSLTRRSASADT